MHRERITKGMYQSEMNDSRYKRIENKVEGQNEGLHGRKWFIREEISGNVPELWWVCGTYIV